MTTAAAATQVPTVIKQVRQELTQMESQFANALPPHIPVARFVRVVMTALQANPKLLKCTRQSLFNAAMLAAQDGLLPDGREGAIVPFGETEDGRPSAEIAKWMPMIAGLRKKARNSGALADWNVQVVQEGDEFEYELGDHPFIRHKPALKGGRARKIIAAYSIATFPNGHISREIMNADQIADIEAKSKSKKGPWSDPIYRPEMARKTVARLHSKQLPSSTDLDTVLRRDDDLYSFGSEREQAREVQRPGSARAALDFFAQGGETVDEDGVITDAKREPAPQIEKPATPATPAPTPPPATSTTPPKTEEDYRLYAKATIAAATSAPWLDTWWKSAEQQQLRKACGVTRELYDVIQPWVNAKFAELSK